jgi:hypothetical protein
MKSVVIAEQNGRVSEVCMYASNILHYINLIHDISSLVECGTNLLVIESESKCSGDVRGHQDSYTYVLQSTKVYRALHNSSARRI